MKKLLVALLLLLLSSFALAQGPPGPTTHSATPTWVNGVDTCTTPTVTNVWRCSGNAATCATALFTLIATVPRPGTSYVDSTTAATNPVIAGSTYTWELDSEAQIGSSCSGHSATTAKVSNTIPLSPSAPNTFTVPVQ